MNLFQFDLFVVFMIVPPWVIHWTMHLPAFPIEWTKFVRVLKPHKAELHNHARRQSYLYHRINGQLY